MISLVETSQKRCHDSGTVISEGKRIALRRERLRWNQDELARRAAVSRSSVWKIEKDKNVQIDMWRAVSAALDAGEAEQSITSLGLDMTGGERVGSALTALQPSLENTHPPDLPRHGGEYQSGFPRGADAPESAADARIRELVEELVAEKAAHAEMRGLAARLTDIIATRLENLETRLAQTGSRKRR